MANIRIDFDHTPYDGENVVFKAPCNASAITGICIHYDNTSQLFEVCDAHGDNVGNIDNLFASGALVTIILDTDDNKAFVQNADTNAYLEGQLASKAASSHTHDNRYYTESEMNTKLSGKANSSHTHTKSQITDFGNGILIQESAPTDTSVLWAF